MPRLNTENTFSIVLRVNVASDIFAVRVLTVPCFATKARRD